MAVFEVRQRERHGEGKKGAESAEYIAWLGMLQRCYNHAHHKYRNYGGRGITVCDRWQKYSLFLLDMGRKPSPDHTIDRKNNDGLYSPDNCRWATQKEQQSNKRSNTWIEVNGIRRTIQQWADTLNVQPSAICARIRRGIAPDTAVTEPFRDFLGRRIV